jgi:hypothetical protein
MRWKFALATALILPLPACVSMGANYSAEAVAQLKPGMSKAEVIALLGRPTSTASLPDGRQQMMWVHSKGSMLGTASGRSIMLMFAPDGTYAGIVSQAETNLR